MNAYTIRYEVFDQVHVRTIFARSANDAYVLGKNGIKNAIGDASLSHATWRSQVLEVVTDATCAYCGDPAGRKCRGCKAFLCGRCGGPEPLCHECLPTEAHHDGSGEGHES